MLCHHIHSKPTQTHQAEAGLVCIAVPVWDNHELVRHTSSRQQQHVFIIPFVSLTLSREQQPQFHLNRRLAIQTLDVSD